MGLMNRRVAFLSEHASPVALLGSVDAGGQNVYIDEVSRNLVAHGWAVDIFTRREDTSAPVVLDWSPGVRVINIDFGPPRVLLKDDMWPHMPEFRDGVLRFIRRERTRYDLIHGNFWMSGWVACEMKRLLDIPAVQIFHATGKTKRRHQGNADTSPDGRIAVEIGVVRDADRLIAQCPAEEQELIDDYAADPDKVVVIPSAVNIERYRPEAMAEARAKIDLPEDCPIIAYIGRMLPRKDPSNIVRALQILVNEHGSDALLLLVGGETREPDPAATPAIGELQRLASELDVADRLRFTGKRQPDELRWFYSAANVAVTTPWYEPFGLTPLEAMACGTPVIGSAVGGITYTIADGETGFLVPPRDPNALAARLRQLLDDPPLRARMSRAARERVEQSFTWQTVAARTVGLYESLIAERMPAQSVDITLERPVPQGLCAS